MQHPTLFKVTARGDIQVWCLEREGAKFRSHIGKLDGAVVTSAWTTCKVKNSGRSNETSPEAQAELEVDAQYTLKRKKGYCDSVDAARASNRFQCMLADKYKERKAKLFDVKGLSLSGALYVQPKLDGIRCIAKREGLFSRENNPIIAVPHIMAALAPLFEKYPDLILDGELYNHELKNDFNEIVSLVKKQKPTQEDLLASEERVQYWIYDCVLEDDEALFSERFDFIKKVIEEFDPPGLTFVGTWPVLYEKSIDEVYEQHLEEGYEGSMIRLNAPYEFKRSKTLLKRKETMDAEFTVVRVDDGEGGAEEMAKRAFCITDDGIEFKADVVGTHVQLRALWKRRDELVGKQATVVFQNYTPDGKPRFGKLKLIHMEGRW